MNNLRLSLASLCLLITFTAWSQLKLSLQQLPDGTSWGVYVNTCNAVSPSSNTITGSGQVTILLPLGNDISDLVNHAGLWDENATVSGPEEAPGLNYISIGFISDSPQIVYMPGEGTLLFSFSVEGNAPGEPQLIDNETDPFADFPNSLNSNPGNEMSVLDIGTVPVGYYYYTGNYTGADDAGCAGVVDTTIVDPPDTTGGNGNPTSTLEQMNEEKYFTLAPNPTSEWITLHFGARSVKTNGQIKLWTASGISIGQLAKNGQSRMTLNVGALPNGLYFLSYESEGRLLQQERFMKQ